MSKKLLHARHNKKACEFLFKDGSYLDWVVTTAFYASIHYVDAILFPYSYEATKNGQLKKYDSFEQLYKDYRKSGGDKNKHAYRSALVNEYCPEICDDFKTLKDNCWTARYKDYKIENEIAGLCLSCLESIEALCEE